MAGVVLDSFALLAYFRDEGGADVVEDLFLQSMRGRFPIHMSEVNYAEVRYMTVRKHGAAAWEPVARLLNTLPIQFHDADRASASSAADFKTRYRISLADAFAAALASLTKSRLITGDREFRPLEKELKIMWI